MTILAHPQDRFSQYLFKKGETFGCISQSSNSPLIKAFSQTGVNHHKIWWLTGCFQRKYQVSCSHLFQLHEAPDSGRVGSAAMKQKQPKWRKVVTIWGSGATPLSGHPPKIITLHCLPIFLSLPLSGTGNTTNLCFVLLKNLKNDRLHFKVNLLSK